MSRYRRLLIDTHIPDWDERFFASFDPAATVRQSVAAGATALMVYFQSHTGLCNWATSSGRQHRALVGRDVMAEMLDESHRADVPVCAYYSVNFNNWAAEQHPDWRMIPAVPEIVIGGGLLPSPRYGICCYNHPDYRAFVRTQTREILAQYPVDAFFFDMVFWMTVCLCDACRGRYRSEAGEEFPQTVDWFDPRWCRFQAARERWLTEQACELHDIVRAERPDIPVYHNLAVAAGKWTRGFSFDSARGHTFLGGDFYGGIGEQLVISRLMMNLSAAQPVEFMTTVGLNLAEHERLKTQAMLDTLALSTTACHAAFLAILAFDPDGTVGQGGLDRVAQTFATLAPYEPWLGGRAIEEVAVYFSDYSKMSFADNGQSVSQAATGSAFDYPHLHALSGACRILQEAHIPFGVITRRQLGDLGRYRVIVLPNLLRMSEEEVAALRSYVREGGSVYASRFTSLTSVAGQRHGDFRLADVFGCHFEAEEAGRSLYLSPTEDGLRQAIAPERALSHWIDAKGRTGAMRLAAAGEGRALATLTLPYGYPSQGSLSGRDWASIHSYPPWERTARPVVVEHHYGKGRSIYSAADLEGGHTASHDASFRALVTSLLGAAPAFSCDAHPSVVMTVFDQSSPRRWVVAFVNTVAVDPILAVPAFQFSLRPPAGERFVRLCRLPDESEVEAKCSADGVLQAVVPPLARFAMYAAELAPSEM
jgi:hypothetical protein